MLLFLLFFMASALSCFAVTYSPNTNAGMISVSVDETSLQNLLTLYENAGFHDFGTVQRVNETEEIKDIHAYYLYDYKLNIADDDFEFSMKGVLDAKARKVVFGYIPAHPDVFTTDIRGAGSAFFKDFNLSDDGKVHLTLCLSDEKVSIDNLSYGYGVFDALVDYAVKGDINSSVQNSVDAATKTVFDDASCIDLTSQIGLNFPEFSSKVKINHAGAKAKEKKITAYGCPIAGTQVGDDVVVGDGPCETVSYKISIYTATDIGQASTDAKVILSLCGDDAFGKTDCIHRKIEDPQDRVTHVLLESSSVFVKNLSVRLEIEEPVSYGFSFEAGGVGISFDSGWYVDSVAVDMALPNNKFFHYWFPIHDWIDDHKASNAITFNQNDNKQVYTFQVGTGDKIKFDHSGTDSDILAEVCDVNNKCLLFNLYKPNYDSFEGGMVTTYTIVTDEKLSNAKKITLYNTYNRGEHEGWYVQDVMYNHYSFPENIDHSLKDGQGFFFRQWLADGEDYRAYNTKYHNPIPSFVSGANDGGFVTFKPVNSGDVIALKYISAFREIKENYGYNVNLITRQSVSLPVPLTTILTVEGCSGQIEKFVLGDDRNNYQQNSEDVFLFSGITDLKGIRKITLYTPFSVWIPDQLMISPLVYNGVDASWHNAFFRQEFPKENIWNVNANSGSWETELSCSDTETPVFYPNIYHVRPGETVTLLGANLNENLNITMSLDRVLQPINVTSTSAIFQIPEDTPVGHYEMGTIKINGVDQIFTINGDVQTIFIYVEGEKPILDGISVTEAKPGDAFEVTIRNVDFSSDFYLDNIKLTVLGLSKNGAYVKIPKNIENGIYKFRVISNGWDLTYDNTVKIIKSVVPHVNSVSSQIAYSGQVLEIIGNNFGEKLESIKVTIGNVNAEIKSLENEKITVIIPMGVSGNDVPVNVIRDEIYAPETIKIEIKSIPWFMSFDDVERPWNSENATITLDISEKVGDFGYSLKVHGDGFKSVVSPVFNTYELGAFSDVLLLDVWIPTDQINLYWYGDVQMSINIPAAGLYNAWIGQVLLTGLQPGWNTLSFNLNQNIYKAISGDYPNATISVILNTNQNIEDYRIDNLRFGGDVKARTTDHVVASRILDVYSVDFMSFDNVNDWMINDQELLFVESPKVQGLGAAGVLASGYTEIKSRMFNLSELKYVSNVISFDVFVPNPQPNDYWVGDVGLGLNCPDLGISSMYLGNKNMTHMFREEFNNVQFVLSNDVVSTLRYGVGKCSFSIYLNVNNGAGTFLLDNMGFIHTVEVASR